jgi:hypothetical protein
MCGGQTKDVLNNERPFILYYPPLSPPSEGIFDGGWTQTQKQNQMRHKLQTTTLCHSIALHTIFGTNTTYHIPHKLLLASTSA